MYQLYIGNKNYSSWSLRPWLLMQTLAIPFEEKQVLFQSNDNSSRFKQFAPNARVPCLHHNQWVVWDSLAIVEYLAERHAGVWPQNAQARSWARSAVAEMHSGFQAIRSYCPFHAGGRFDKSPYPDAVLQDLKRLEQLWQEGLQRFAGPYLAGAEFSAADAFYAPVLFRLQSYQLPVTAAVTPYIQLMMALPAMQLWYQQALAEPFWDDEHEMAALGSGQLLADHRLGAASSSGP
jgi:glutathione S-transferase